MLTRTKSSTTKLDERQREQSTTLSRTYGVATRKYGTIVDIHATGYACSVRLFDGGMAANGAFIPITNPWNTFVQEFGNLRTGLLVELNYTGEMDINPYATIIGLEEELPAAPQQPPTVDLSIYAIFSPGA